jgi:hypothetical protein
MKSTALALSIVLAASLKSAYAFTPQGVPPSKGTKASSEIAYKSGSDATELTATEQKQMKLKRIIENQKNLYANKSPWRVTRPTTPSEDNLEPPPVKVDPVADISLEEVDMDIGAISLLESKDVKAYIKHLKAKREKKEEQEDTTHNTELSTNISAKPSKEIDIKVNTFGANARISTVPPKKAVLFPPKQEVNANTPRAKPNPNKNPPGRTWLSAAEKIKMAREAAKAKLEEPISAVHAKIDTKDESELLEAKKQHSLLETKNKNEKSEEEIAAALKEKMIQEYIAHLEEKRKKNGEKVQGKSVVVTQGAMKNIQEDFKSEVRTECHDDTEKPVLESKKSKIEAPKKSNNSKEIDELKNLLNSLVQRTDKFLDEPEGVNASVSSNIHVPNQSQAFPTIIESPDPLQSQSHSQEKHWTELVSQPILFRSMDMIGKPLTEGELAQIKAQQERRKQRTRQEPIAQQQQQHHQHQQHLSIASKESHTPVAQRQLRSSNNSVKSTRNPGHDYTTSFDKRMSLNPNQEPAHVAPSQRNTVNNRNPGLDYTTSFDQRMGLNPNQEPINQTSSQQKTSRNPGYDYTTSFDQRIGLNPNDDSVQQKMRAARSRNPGYDYTTSFDQRMGLNPDGSERRRQSQNVQFKTVNQLDMNGNPISTSSNRRNPSHDYSTSFDQRVGGFAGRPTESYGFPQPTEEPEEVLTEEVTFPNLEEEKAQRDAEEVMKEKLIQEYIALFKERRDKEQQEKEPQPGTESKKKGSIFHFKTLCEEPREENW